MTVTPRRERRERELRRRQREKRGGGPSRGGGGGGRGLLIGIGGVVLAVVVILGPRPAGRPSLGWPAASSSPLPTAGAIAADDPARGGRETEDGSAHATNGTP